MLEVKFNGNLFVKIIGVWEDVGGGGNEREYNVGGLC
jgi:hypothetical protein